MREFQLIPKLLLTLRDMSLSQPTIAAISNVLSFLLQGFPSSNDLLRCDCLFVDSEVEVKWAEWSWFLWSPCSCNNYNVCRHGKGFENQPKTLVDLDIKAFSIRIVSAHLYSSRPVNSQGVCHTHTHWLPLFSWFSVTQKQMKLYYWMSLWFEHWLV